MAGYPICIGLIVDNEFVGLGLMIRNEFSKRKPDTLLLFLTYAFM